MLYYIIAATLVLHTVFWGLGLSWLVLPRHWRRWWWAFAPAAGIALQSAVVWVGAHTTLAGTNRYALWSELLPLGLLVAAIARHGWPRSRGWLGAGWNLRGVVLLALLAGAVLVWPMARRGNWTLTTSSLGSCDQADYAAGIRVLQEFSKDDRTGFLGLAEVTQVGSAEHFFDYWIRLNHFTPAALLAHHGAVLDLQPHQLVSLGGVALLLLNAPLLLLLARVAGGLRGVSGLVPVALYLVSPLGAYAVHHGALGQLLAAQGIALLTFIAFAAGRGRITWPRAWAWAPLALIAYWILAGSYNFVLVIALAPGVAWLLALAVSRRDGCGPLRIGVMLLAALAACAGLFWGRFDGLVERFQLFEKHDFGWPVPLLSPEGWLGVLRDTSLNAWSQPVRFGLSAVIVAAWLAGVVMLWRRWRSAAWAALALVLPVLAGWGLLVWEARVRANASYDAFKLLSVFYPGLLVGLTGWLAILWSARPRWRLAGLALVAPVLFCNGRLTGMFAREMAAPPLRVERPLLEVRRLEQMPQVTSLNIRVVDYWSRLWANALLLRKPQYFVTHSYEARRDTELKGEWNLSDSPLRSRPANAADFVDINPQFHAVRVAAPGRVDLGFGEGWHAPEGAGLDRWRWSSGPAGITIFNPTPQPLKVNLSMQVRSLDQAQLLLDFGDKRIGMRPLDGRVQPVEFNDVVLPPGASTLSLRTDTPPGHAAGGDSRLLALALYNLTVQAVP